MSKESRLLLMMRQQPVHARVSTSNERDRRPIDPPPIVQISFAKETDSDAMHGNLLQSLNYFMCANLAHPTNDAEIYTPNHNALSGQTVSSMYKFKDVDNQDGGFFVFGDLSVKVQGMFRLKLSLFEITMDGAAHVKSIFTQPFTVYSGKAFPGTLDSTFLSRCFSDQGARIRIRKEIRNPIPNCKRKASDSPVSCLGQSPEVGIKRLARKSRRTSNDDHIYPKSSTNDLHNGNSSHGVNDSHMDSTIASPQHGPITFCHDIGTTPVSPPHQPYDKPDEHFQRQSSLSCLAMPSPPLPWASPCSLPAKDKPAAFGTIQLPSFSQLIHSVPDASSLSSGHAEAATAMIELAQCHRDPEIDHRRPW